MNSQVDLKISQKKSQARQKWRKLLKELPDRAIQDRQIQQRLREWFHRWSSGGGYWGVFAPLPQEPQVMDVWHDFQQRGQSIAFATVWAQKLVWSLQPADGGWRWTKPPPEDFWVRDQDVRMVFCPALAVDRRGCRLGQGGGFYDRWLGQFPHVLKVAVIYRQQWTPWVPCCSHDVRMDVIITPDGILAF